jgi:NADH-quinone oxidoreductase subunit L
MILSLHIWLIPLLPLAGFLLNGILGARLPRWLVSTIGLLAPFLSFVLVLNAYALTSYSAVALPYVETFPHPWIAIGGLRADFSFFLDPLSLVMLLVVTGVGFLIHIYSVGYMAHEEGYARYFSFLNLFLFFMTVLVLAGNVLLLFVGWEGVGLASYLLIGFYFKRASAAAAGKKAFIVNRIGDFGFLIGIFLILANFGTLNFTQIAQVLTLKAAWHGGVLTAICLCLLVGAAGKSAQLPLYVWLPDAMEGPTPVSALIHAATMVAAGVYLIARVYPLMAAGSLTGGTSTALIVITWVGAFTAVFAALIAVAQNDIKRILAYSTVSQLGYMMAGLGMGGVAVGMFHLITHAFFKALLFMGAGSVIHGCHEEQDIRKMGGLKADMPLTFITYATGMLALCGFPLFFSGFWSKDGILEAAHGWSISHAPFYMLGFGALLTAFYMTRQVSYVFLGVWRGHKAAHESPAVMVLPLLILAFFAVVLGVLGTPAWPWFHGFLEGHAAPFDLHALFEPGLLLLMLTSSVIVLLGLGLGLRVYGGKSPKSTEPDTLEKAVPWLWAILRDRFYIDELYAATIVAFYGWWGRVADFIDRRILGGAVNLVTGLTTLVARFNRFLDATFVNGGFDKTCEELATSGGLLARVQSGRVQGYLRILALAVVALAAILVWSSRP